jgi:excisionase family DNA binding protein|tara:strand:- start:1013 stop:1267 length:255 start_codon:yes stop_codon:yes gene_type:complete
MMSEYVTINAVAEKFNVSISTIRQWIRKDNIPRNTYIKVGNTYRFILEEVENSLREIKPDTTQKWQDTLSEKEDTLELNLDDDV